MQKDATNIPHEIMRAAEQFTVKGTRAIMCCFTKNIYILLFNSLDALESRVVDVLLGLRCVKMSKCTVEWVGGRD